MPCTASLLQKEGEKCSLGIAFVDAGDVKGLQFSVRVSLVGFWFAKWLLKGNLTLLRYTTDSLLAGRAVGMA